MRSIVPRLVAVALVVTACGGETAGTTTEATTPTTQVDTTTTTVESTTTTESVTTTTPETTTTTEVADPYTFDIVLEGSAVSGGGRLSVPVGETVTLRFASDIDDEVHIHGYDIYVDLVAGETAEVSFPADIPGTVEIELHHGGREIASLEAS